MFVGICVLYLFTFLFWNYVWKRRKLPPGPAPLPLFGNLRELLSFPDDGGARAYLHFAEQYGPVYTLWMGEDPYVIVTDLELLRAVFQKADQADKSAGRHFFGISAVATETHGLFGVTRTDGDAWRFIRRNALSTLRDLGMGRNKMSAEMLVGLRKMSADIRAQIARNGSSQEVNLVVPVNELVGTSINILLFGHPLEEEHLDEFHAVKKDLRILFQMFTWQSIQILASLWWLRFLPPFSSVWRQADNYISTGFHLVDREIGEILKRRAKYPGQEHISLVDRFLDEMERSAERTKKCADVCLGQDKYFHMESLRSTCFDFFIASNETTASVMSFMLLYMILDQRSQERLHAELENYARENSLIGQGDEECEGDRVDSRCSAIGLEHRPNLVYTNAVINETLRMVNLLPFNLGHQALEDLRVGDFHIKRGTAIVPQVSAVLLNPEVFPDPYKFCPERFIDAKGNLRKADEMVAFGLGKRQCAGEAQARTAVFLFAANFFLAYRVSPADPLQPPSAAKVAAITVYAHDFVCRVDPY